MVGLNKLKWLLWRLTWCLDDVGEFISKFLLTTVHSYNFSTFLVFIQSSQRILVIMGVINFPELGNDSHLVEKELASFAQRYPSVLVKRFFVFNYTFNSSVDKVDTPFFLNQPKSADPDSIIVLPPADAICEGGSMIDVHLHEIMTTVSVTLLTVLEDQLGIMEQAKAKNIIPSTLTSLSTPFDDIEDQDTSQTFKLKPAIKRKPLGRTRKFMGDLCLQV